MGQVSSTIYIAASGDDADCTTLGTIAKTGLYLRCEQPSTPTYDIFLRFQLPDIYQGSVIGAAFLYVYAYQNCVDDYDPVIYVEDVVNSAAYGDSENLELRTLWTTSVTFTTGAWTALTQYTSPDIKALIQRITDKATYVPGNYITLKLDCTAAKGDDERRIYSWDYDNANATTYRGLLVITHSHACYPPSDGTEWIINSTTGSCILYRSLTKVHGLWVTDAQYLDLNGFDIEFDTGHDIRLSDSGSKILCPSGSKLVLVNA